MVLVEASAGKARGLQLTVIAEIGGDPSRTKAVAVDGARQARGLGAPFVHVKGIAARQRRSLSGLPFTPQTTIDKSNTLGRDSVWELFA